jgi:hypothetical protein
VCTISSDLRKIRLSPEFRNGIFAQGVAGFIPGLKCYTQFEMFL